MNDGMEGGKSILVISILQEVNLLTGFLEKINFSNGIGQLSYQAIKSILIEETIMHGGYQD